MFQLMDKKIITILHSQNLLNWPCEKKDKSARQGFREQKNLNSLHAG